MQNSDAAQMQNSDVALMQNSDSAGILGQPGVDDPLEPEKELLEPSDQSDSDDDDDDDSFAADDDKDIEKGQPIDDETENVQRRCVCCRRW